MPISKSGKPAPARVAANPENGCQPSGRVAAFCNVQQNGNCEPESDGSEVAERLEITSRAGDSLQNGGASGAEPKVS